MCSITEIEANCLESLCTTPQNREQRLPGCKFKEMCLPLEWKCLTITRIAGRFQTTGSGSTDWW